MPSIDEQSGKDRPLRVLTGCYNPMFRGSIAGIYLRCPSLSYSMCCPENPFDFFEWLVILRWLLFEETMMTGIWEERPAAF